MGSADGIEAFSDASYKLYLKLIAPLDIRGQKRLIIVPHGILGYLPFEVLLKGPIQKQFPKAMNFLLKDHMINYAYSATLLSIQNESPIPSQLKTLGIFPIFENSPQYLSNSENEIDILEKFDSHILRNGEANIENFLNEVSHFDIIHLYTHAVAEDSLLRQPAFHFSDSILYPSDLYTLNIPAHMVVMSACQTGLGQQRNGEGIMSLARGFNYAGVPSVLPTLWKVHDKTTAQIMALFYKNIQKGLSKDEALHKAKVDFLNNCSDAESAPYYWAGFIHIGNSHSIELVPSSTSYLWLFIPVLLGLVFIFFKKKHPHPVTFSKVIQLSTETDKNK